MTSIKNVHYAAPDCYAVQIEPTLSVMSGNNSEGHNILDIQDEPFAEID